MSLILVFIDCRWLVTHLGGFFIKRKLDTAAGKDILYIKCLPEVRETLTICRCLTMVYSMLCLTVRCTNGDLVGATCTCKPVVFSYHFTNKGASLMTCMCMNMHMYIA